MRQEICHRTVWCLMRAKGYHLIGREEDKHRLALYALSNCLQSSIGVWALDYILKSWGEENP
ncbi:hypothetical protein QKW61_013760, partial [Staphylococcus nepalensis]|nr:hypothetical protein [Staphylococcus nepalensis]